MQWFICFHDGSNQECLSIVHLLNQSASCTVDSCSNMQWFICFHDGSNQECLSIVHLLNQSASCTVDSCSNKQRFIRFLLYVVPQILQLMRTDSYSRFLKSDLYKDYLMREMEGHTLSLPNTTSTVAAQEDVKKKVRFSLFCLWVATIIMLIIMLLLCAMCAFHTTSCCPFSYEKVEMGSLIHIVMLFARPSHRRKMGLKESV